MQVLILVYQQELNPSDTKGFGTTSDTNRLPLLSHKYQININTPLTQEHEIVVMYRFILECLIKGKVDQISFVLSPL